MTMSTQHPTPADLRTIADNLWAEGQHSRAEVIYNAADHMELLEVGTDKLTPAFAAQTEKIARLQAVEVAAREVLERFEWYKKLAEEGKGVSDSGYLSVSVMTLWDKQDQLAYDALAAALTQPGDGDDGG
jgi:hypothetical protein